MQVLRHQEEDLTVKTGDRWLEVLHFHHLSFLKVGSITNKVDSDEVKVKQTNLFRSSLVLWNFLVSWKIKLCLLYQHFYVMYTYKRVSLGRVVGGDTILWEADSHSHFWGDSPIVGFFHYLAPCILRTNRQGHFFLGGGPYTSQSCV